MQDAILNFHKQFEFEPEIINKENLKKADKFIVCGMGGSHLAADLLKAGKPELNLIVHSDYGLPELNKDELKNSLVIFSSYSGNTEEVLDAYNIAKSRGLDMAIISVGGKLLELAQDDSVPYVEMPNTGIQPRSALGFNIKGLASLMDIKDVSSRLFDLSNQLDSENFESMGKELANRLKNKVPVIYSSRRNQSIAYNWKIKFNETGKIPAFYNIFPELNHNEMTGFDVNDESKGLSENFYFIFLKDSSDHPKIQKRMDITSKLYEDRGLTMEFFDLEGDNVWLKIFSSLILADWTAVYTAENYGLEPEQVPMVEEFKGMI